MNSNKMSTERLTTQQVLGLASNPAFKSTHGLRGEQLVERILRQRIYECRFWKEQCFALGADTVVDKGIKLKEIGGMYGGVRKPTDFICLILKLLQLRPEKAIVLEYIRNKDFKYLRCLGAFYLRLTGSAHEVYTELEPLYNDYRKIRVRSNDTVYISHVDEFVDELLTTDYSCNIALPHLLKRGLMEKTGTLGRRISKLDDEMRLMAFTEMRNEGNDESLQVDSDPSIGMVGKGSRDSSNGNGKSEKKNGNKDKGSSDSDDRSVSVSPPRGRQSRSVSTSRSRSRSPSRSRSASRSVSISPPRNVPNSPPSSKSNSSPSRRRHSRSRSRSRSRSVSRSPPRTRSRSVPRTPPRTRSRSRSVSRSPRRR